MMKRVAQRGLLRKDSSSQLGVILTLITFCDVWVCFLVVRTWESGGCRSLLVGRGQRAAKYPTMHRVSAVPRLRKVRR